MSIAPARFPHSQHHEGELTYVRFAFAPLTPTRRIPPFVSPLSSQMGNWELSRVPPSKPLPITVRDRVFSAYSRATELEKDNYKAWHSWAMVGSCVLSGTTTALNILSTPKSVSLVRSMSYTVCGAQRTRTRKVLVGVLYTPNGLPPFRMACNGKRLNHVVW